MSRFAWIFVVWGAVFLKGVPGTNGSNETVSSTVSNETMSIDTTATVNSSAISSGSTLRTLRTTSAQYLLSSASSVAPTSVQLGVAPSTSASSTSGGSGHTQSTTTTSAANTAITRRAGNPDTTKAAPFSTITGPVPYTATTRRTGNPDTTKAAPFSTITGPVAYTATTRTVYGESDTTKTAPLSTSAPTHVSSTPNTFSSQYFSSSVAVVTSTFAGNTSSLKPTPSQTAQNSRANGTAQDILSSSTSDQSILPSKDSTFAPEDTTAFTTMITPFLTETEEITATIFAANATVSPTISNTTVNVLRSSQTTGTNGNNWGGKSAARRPSVPWPMVLSVLSFAFLRMLFD